MLGAPVFRTALYGPWSGNALWTAARAVPSLDLRFAESKSLTDAVSGQSLVTFTRASSGTYVGSNGVLQTATTNEPRFDHNPTTGESLGLLVEEQRTNLLLNSGTLSTQNVTVTAVAHTLSFTGTGTITLTGTSTAGPLVGTGTGESNRVSLTFTPTAGSLTLTVSGTVTNAQLEAGVFRTSYIPTTTATATRSADVASITGTNFSSWYSQSEGTVFAETQLPAGTAVNTLSRSIVDATDGSTNNRVNLRAIASATNTDQLTIRSGAVTVAQFASAGTNVSTTARKIAAVYKLDDYASWATGATSAATDTSGAIPVGVNQITVGSAVGGGEFMSGTIRRLCFWPARLPNSTLQQITQ